MNHAHLQNAEQACWDCRHTIQKTLMTHCLPIGGVHMEERHVRAMVDCMEICQTTADFLTRESDFHAQLCELTAEICKAAAKSCEQIGDEKMMACAKAARACADTCKEFAELSEAA